ncbi:MAG: hypothetical protein ACRYF2_16310 [Janthinobacterium lividum]
MSRFDPPESSAHLPSVSSPIPIDPAIVRSNRPVWIAFLLVCFVLTGMVGLFASYGPAIPLQRALHRIEAVDRAVASGTPDAAALQTALGKSADDVLSGPGDLPTRTARARAAIIADAEEDTAGVGARTRLMIFVITALSGLIGVFIVLVVSRQNTN